MAHVESKEGHPKADRKTKALNCFRPSLVFIWFIDRQGPGWGVSGIDPARHPVMGEPLSPTWIELFKHLSEVVGLFAAWRQVRERLVGLLHLIIVHLRENRSDYS